MENRAHQSILSVDDDQGLRELLHELISQMGHTSETAVDGVDALEKMEEKHFDIVVTDINMPRLKGTIFLPDRETAIGQKIVPQRARPSNAVVSCQRLEPSQRAFAGGGGSFPWPLSPGQGKNNLLCASVVNF